MRSTMQEIPLSVARILEYGSTVHGATTVTTWGPSGPEVTTFAAIGARAAALANGLRDELGIDGDQRVGTLMWNCAEHLEAFLAVASMGAVFQPVNKQLMPDQIAHIIRHAHDEVLIIDPRMAPMLGPVLKETPGVRAVIVIDAEGYLLRDTEEHIPDGIAVYSYEEFLDGRPSSFDWPEIPETEGAAMCYSTGTVGAPKGVVYSQRSIYLHSLNLRTTDSFGITHGVPWLCCVPIYHVLSWGVPLAAFACGAPLVFPGADLSAPRLAEIVETSMPRVAQGVPTLWIGLMVHYLNNPPERMSLQEIFVGGSPCPPGLIRVWEQRYGVDVIHLWGMTETSPIGTVSRPPYGASGEARERYRVSQGRFPELMEFRIVDDDGKVLELHDRNSGELQVRGNTVTARYYHSPDQDDGGDAHVFRGDEVDDATSKFTDDGWLRTGDIGSITRDAYLTVQDRAKDVIRSGGEWIYSVQLENLVMEAPEVVECAVIGYPDRKWGERPLAVTVLIPGTPKDESTAEALRERLKKKLPNWMAPEYWTFVDHIDKTSVDKFDKKDLRTHLADGDFEIVELPGPGSI
ncbi:long-chain fatty-acid--CoA ligase [Corynebacterium sp.]|uniref:long-chain fatty-acid--CoA ligase n=1 Tax=Corynebacterium sp. TaxID=1720 RepID=UPI0026DAA326|nr:long-chain fatty-acid--CoA ligase [Corynebacterium sp.]MDO4610141.1 long-chain fatty-acid--CoA ligase [Corynebacterium sp.]